MGHDEGEDGPGHGEAFGTAAQVSQGAADRDWLLQALLNLMSSLGFSADVTLLYGGALVSGTPVSEQAYFEALGTTFRTGLGGEGHPQFAKAVEEWLAEQGKTLQERVSGSDDLIDQPRAYVNLTRVTIQTGSETVDCDLWRGRLAEVSGWFVGRLES